eukprot:gene18951-20857_t
MKIISYIRNKLTNSNISFLVGLIVCLFGTGSWISINGLWVELPILVSHAPEKWKLPSYLAVIVQLGNIGPLAYTLGSKYAPRIIKETLVIHIIIAIGAIACFLLGLFWKDTTVVAGSSRSTALFTLVFFLSLMSCTSSVTFLPFMGRFKSSYIVAFFVGQGFSGLLPSLLALIQGVGASSIKCTKSSPYPSINGNFSQSLNSTATSTLSKRKEQPLFSANGFFFFLLVVMLLCEVAFLLLNYLPKAKREHAHAKKKSKVSATKFTVQKDESKPLEGRHLSLNSETEQEPSELLELELATVDKDSQSSLVSDSVYTETVEDTNDSPTLAMKSILLVLFLQVLINSICNGVIPSLLSYACLPYGEKTYHLALTLSAIANPIASFLFYAVVLNSVTYMVFWTGFYVALSAYVVAIAAKSPCPPLHDNTGGSFLIVFIAVAGSALANYLRTALSTILRNQGQKALLWCGISIQVGSFIGAVLIFPFVNILHVFKQ